MAKGNSITNKVKNGLKVKSDLEKLEDKVVFQVGGKRISFTKKNKELLKKNQKIAEKSAKVNRNKVRHHKTNKEKRNS
jgi:hypothetical protein